MPERNILSSEAYDELDYSDVQVQQAAAISTQNTIPRSVTPLSQGYFKPKLEIRLKSRNGMAAAIF